MRQASQERGFAWPPSADDLAALEVVELRDGRWTARLVAPAVQPRARHQRLVPAPPARPRPSRVSRSSWVLAAGVLFGSMLPGTPDGRAPIVGVLRTLGVGSSRVEGPRAVVVVAGAGPVARPAVAPRVHVDAGPVREPSTMVVAAALEPAGAASLSAAAPVKATSTRRPGAGARRRPAPRRSPEERQVLDVMRQYEAAFSRMDVARLQALWPASDRQALTRTFGETSEHRLTLARCAVDVADVRATTRCTGVLRARPRRSEERTRVQRGEWTFHLEHDAGRWEIASVVSR